MYCDKLKETVFTASDAPVVSTSKGKIAGIKKQEVYIFRGIKYAEARRFHMPADVQPWSGVKPAVTYGYVCPEPITPITSDFQFNPHYFMPQDENCQYLNIWTPSIDSASKKPVMVWMHGGGWSSGSAVEQYAYDGEELAKFGDVVVVTFNHRHNCLGGMDLSAYGKEYELSSCCGLGDVIMLLQWVKNHIESFGGDPENVMVFGQSGGVAKILYAMQCPQGDGLFQKAAIDSGGIKEQAVPPGWTKRSLAGRLTELTLANLQISKEHVQRIEEIPYWDLADAVLTAEKRLQEESGLNGRYRWEPVEDGKYVEGSTLADGFRKETRDIPMLIGNVFGEGNSNMLPENQIGDGRKNSWSMEQVKRYCREKWGEKGMEILTEFRAVYPENNPADVLFMDYKERNGQLGLVKKRLEIGADVWNWLFKKESALSGGTVAWHCSEIPYIFHNTSYIEAAFEPGISEELEKTICSAWLNMARYGNPNGLGVPHWNKAAGNQIPTMIFDVKCEERTGYDDKLRSLLEKADRRI